MFDAMCYYIGAITWGIAAGYGLSKASLYIVTLIVKDTNWTIELVTFWNWKRKQKRTKGSENGE